jgi:hypothetical protein
VCQRLAGDDGDIGAGLQAHRQILLVCEVLRCTLKVLEEKRLHIPVIGIAAAATAAMWQREGMQK